MKMTRSLLTRLAFAALVFSQTGCKKTNDPTKGFSANIQSIIPQADIDKLRQRGMLINEGSQPPNIEGIFASSPHTLVSPYDTDSYSAGYVFNDLVIRFSKQNTADQTAVVDIKNAGSTGTGVGGFLAGTGNQFTFFAEIDLVDGSATAKQVRIFSGEITSTGIKNFYTTLLMKSKNDPTDRLIPVGAARVLKDGDGLASKQSSFRLHAAAPSTAPTADDATR